MPSYGTWVSFRGGGAVVLAVALLAVAGGLASLTRRLPRALEARRPGRAGAALLIVLWLLSIATFLVALGAYIEQLHQEHLAYPAPVDPITFVTLAAALATFVVILQTGASRGPRVALTSAVIGASVGVMVFELPFDLIVMSRTYPPIPPSPGLYRALFFLPLFAVEVATLSLLTLSPMVKLSRSTLVVLAAMFGVWAIWALFGFAYPSSPGPIILNVVSKLLAFVATLTLFLPEQAERWYQALGGRLRRPASGAARH